MSNNVEITGNQVRVTLSGLFCAEEALALRTAIFGYIDNGHISILIDLSAVDYIDGSGLETLVLLQKRALKHGGSVTLTGLHGLVKDLFELTRLNKSFDIQ